tara:strand:- start:10968 stop:11708 length:741 start_codon:yes stop_codon:yes gene_type:complete
MKINDISFVILSFDKFKATWKPSIDHFFNAWPDCPYTVYLLNNFIPSEDERVIDLLVGEDENWSDTLKKGLLKIDSKRIFFLYDDVFITNIDVQEVESIFKIAIENDFDSVALRRRKFDSGKRFNKKLYKINATAKYRNSLYQNLIKKDVLLSLLKSGENTWQFEKDANIRSKNLDFYSVYETNLITEHHGIIKGKWMPEVYKYLRNEGYSLDDDIFEHHSKFRVLTMATYTLIFYAFHKFTHLFK